MVSPGAKESTQNTKALPEELRAGPHEQLLAKLFVRLPQRQVVSEGVQLTKTEIQGALRETKPVPKATRTILKHIHE